MIEATEKSIHNRSAIQKGVACGCYFCSSVIDGGDIVEWCDAGDTAICPICGVDSILVGVVDEEELGRIYDQHFGNCGEDGV